jgi:hypothetical protein
MSTFTLDDKKCIMTKIQNLKNKKHYMHLYRLIKDNNVTYSQNNNGVFINLNNISDDILEKIVQYLNYLDTRNSEIDSEFYLHICRKANVINGIHYTDPLFLRMMMFLELSRPMGMISRWKKVWERLDLLDKAQPLISCNYTRPSFLKDHTMTKVHPIIMKYILTNKRVYLGANIFAIYNKTRQSMEVKAKNLLDEISPVIFLSHDADMDARNLKDMIDFIGPIRVKEIARPRPPFARLDLAGEQSRFGQKTRRGCRHVRFCGAKIRQSQ